MSRRLTLAVAICFSSCVSSAIAQAGTVSAQFRPASAAAKSALSNVVLWLTPIDGPLPPPVPRNNLKLVQRNKEFIPHLLVVPAGSSVDFPNADPFFHNVFSLFNGKRFDLGLYEAGTHRAVRFDREGVSYIFCNIHPEMGAVVLALNSPYYAVSTRRGDVTMQGVPPGRYHIHVWGERVHLASTSDTQRTVQVTSQGAAIGPLSLVSTPDPLIGHKNKFGDDYPSASAPKY